MTGQHSGWSDIEKKVLGHNILSMITGRCYMQEDKMQKIILQFSNEFISSD